MALGQMLQLLLLLGFFGWMFWAFFFRRSHRSPKQADDGPTDQTYKVYTKRFDREEHARGLDKRLMSFSLDSAKGDFILGHREWDHQATIALQKIEDLGDNWLVELSNGTAGFHDSAVTILIDHSGSLKGEPIVWTAAGVRKLADILIKLGAKVEVLGFTTAGWHGGHPRMQWIADRRPTRPGRLCALMHVIYKEFDESSLDPDVWRQMLNPNILRENIDGEALEWAEQRLIARPEKHRVLLMLSDGAPVDDSTLMENGPSFLTRHVRAVIERIHETGAVKLLAVGLNFKVNEWYPESAEAASAEQLVGTALGMVHQCINPTERDTRA